jgi:hypothetical protein
MCSVIIKVTGPMLFVVVFNHVIQCIGQYLWITRDMLRKGQYLSIFSFWFLIMFLNQCIGQFEQVIQCIGQFEQVSFWFWSGTWCLIKKLSCTKRGDG